jgi:hypothetical protein
MAMKNAKSIRNTLRQFVRDNGREPTLDEARDLLAGRARKKEKK